MITEATTFPLEVLKTRNELSQIPPAYKYFPSELTANKLDDNLIDGWNGPTIFLRFLEGVENYLELNGRYSTILIQYSLTYLRLVVVASISNKNPLSLSYDCQL